MMNRLSLLAAAAGAFFTVSSVVPLAALPSPPRLFDGASQIEKAQVTLKFKTWRGHRGYRYKRPGYRRHTDGFWYPNAAFTVRVAPPAVRFGTRHVRWCRERYRSYRVSDNTYVIRAGVRRACRSPYR
jgi:hypothetical protein